MPTVYQHDENYRRVSTRCPLCSDGTRIMNNTGAWKAHMTSVHSADPWVDTPPTIFGGQEGPMDGPWATYRMNYKCWICGATFWTEAELIEHLSTVHSAT